MMPILQYETKNTHQQHDRDLRKQALPHVHVHQKSKMLNEFRTQSTTAAIPIQPKQFRYDKMLKSFTNSQNTVDGGKLTTVHNPLTPEPIRIQHLPFLSGFKLANESKISKLVTDKKPVIYQKIKKYQETPVPINTTTLNNETKLVNMGEFSANTNLHSFNITTSQPQVIVSKQEKEQASEEYQQQGSNAHESTHISPDELNAEELLNYLVGPDAGGYGKKLTALSKEIDDGNQKNINAQKSSAAQNINILSTPNDIISNSNEPASVTTGEPKINQAVVYHEEVDVNLIPVVDTRSGKHNENRSDNQNSYTISNESDDQKTKISESEIVSVEKNPRIIIDEKNVESEVESPISNESELEQIHTNRIRDNLNSFSGKYQINRPQETQQQNSDLQLQNQRPEEKQQFNNINDQLVGHVQKYEEAKSPEPHQGNLISIPKNYFVYFFVP